MFDLVPNPAWLQGVRYDPIARRHQLDGQRVPSVTQALAFAHPDRFARIPAPVLARKAGIGTAVHAAAHYHAEGDLDETTLADEVRPHVDAWKWFFETRQVDPLLCETVVCSRDLGLPPSRRRPYIGRLDFLCVVDRKYLVLVDIKTGSPTLARVQTQAYLDALLQQYPHLIPEDVHRWAVVCDAAGRYRVHAFRDEADDHRAFRQALRALYATFALEEVM